MILIHLQNRIQIFLVFHFQSRYKIKKIIKIEEERFAATIDNGLVVLNGYIKDAKDAQEKDDLDDMKAKKDKLQEKIVGISSKIYEEAAKARQSETDEDDSDEDDDEWQPLHRGGVGGATRHILSLDLSLYRHLQGGGFCGA